MVAHNKPNHRQSWALNGEKGWTIGISPEHYRCIKCFFEKTRSERDVDTVTFFPTIIPFPSVTTTDYLKQAATDIITILTSPPSPTTPSLQAGDPIRNALLDLATLLNRAQPLPAPSPYPTENTTKNIPVPRVSNTNKDTSKPSSNPYRFGMWYEVESRASFYDAAK